MSQKIAVGSRSKRGEAASVAQHDGEEFAGVPIAGDVALRFGEGAEEPAEIVPVGPDGDVDLVPAEERNGGADAVDRWAIGEVAFEVEAKALLSSAADGDDDVLGTKAVEAFEQSRIIDRGVAVHGSHVDGVFRNDDSLPCKPVQIEFGAGGAGHDPEGVAGFANVGFKKEFAQVFESGETFDWDGLQAVPDQDHEGRVGDGEVRVEEGVAIIRTAIEVFESRGCRDDEKAAVGSHDFYGFLCGAIEEVDAEDAVGEVRCRHEEVRSFVSYSRYEGEQLRNPCRVTLLLPTSRLLVTNLELMTDSASLYKSSEE